LCNKDIQHIGREEIVKEARGGRGRGSTMKDIQHKTRKEFSYKPQKTEKEHGHKCITAHETAV
jgi:hypothetical protein